MGNMGVQALVDSENHHIGQILVESLNVNKDLNDPTKAKRSERTRKRSQRVIDIQMTLIGIFQTKAAGGYIFPYCLYSALTREESQLSHFTHQTFQLPTTKCGT